MKTITHQEVCDVIGVAYYLKNSLENRPSKSIAETLRMVKSPKTADTFETIQTWFNNKAIVTPSQLTCLEYFPRRERNLILASTAKKGTVEEILIEAITHHTNCGNLCKILDLLRHFSQTPLLTEAPDGIKSLETPDTPGNPPTCSAPNTNTTMQKYAGTPLATVTLVHGSDIKDLSVNDIHGYIRNNNNTIKALKELGVESAAIKRQIEGLEASTVALVAELDSRPA